MDMRVSNQIDKILVVFQKKYRSFSPKETILLQNLSFYTAGRLAIPRHRTTIRLCDWLKISNYVFIG